MLIELFHELNDTYFQSQLPQPTLSWNSRLSSSAGRFCPGSRNFLRPRLPEIEVATYLCDLPDGKLHVRDTILHELIHYFLWHNGRPYGHTAEFHDILKRVGAKRYNTVPKHRPVKHWYSCPSCEKRIPTKRKIGISACAVCCERYNRGKYHERFRLQLVITDTRKEELGTVYGQQALPEVELQEACIPPSEIIRRLEELKQMLRVRS